MKSNLKCWCGAITAVSIIVSSMAGSVSKVYAENSTPGVIPPNAKAYGMTYGEWSAKWWQWNFSLPVAQNPSFDENGCSNGANGQLGPVWFLTGVINESGTAVRNCIVPAGKALFFPIINAECSTLEPPPFYGGNEAELRACINEDYYFRFENVFAELDGVPVQNLDRYLVGSPLFTFAVPENNVLGVPPGSTGQSVSKGYYLMLTPLSVGKHVIHFGGRLPYFNFALDITYNLTVAPKKP